MRQYISGIDLVIEVLDARIPMTSRNPDISQITRMKPRVVVLAKADLAEPKDTEAWRKILAAEGHPCYAVNAETGEGVKDVVSGISRLAREVMTKLKDRRRKMRPLRAMVVGIPNVGKSSLINRLAGRKSAKIGAKPGVTTGRQWIKVGNNIELLDMPGVLSPRVDDPLSIFKLAATGALAEDSYDSVEVAHDLLKILQDKTPATLGERFHLEDIRTWDSHRLLHAIGERRGCLGAGGTVDTLRAGVLVLSEFRKGLLGKVTLDNAEDYGGETHGADDDEPS